MSKRVLNVGQCHPDHAAISRLLEQNFGATVIRTHELEDTLRELQQYSADLILINRKLDLDYSDGMNILRHLKSDPRWSAIPTMIISNYPEFQQAAVSAGAVPGFGKDELRSLDTIEKLKPFLDDER